VLIDGPQQVRLRVWQVPTPGSRPHDPIAGKEGSIWYTGQLSNKLDGSIREVHSSRNMSSDARTGPHGLAEVGRQYLVPAKRRPDRQARPKAAT